MSSTCNHISKCFLNGSTGFNCIKLFSQCHFKCRLRYIYS
nr:MAG TPA: hypothetical protein [Crassvirales sp.]